MQYLSHLYSLDSCSCESSTLPRGPPLKKWMWAPVMVSKTFMSLCCRNLCCLSKSALSSQSAADVVRLWLCLISSLYKEDFPLVQDIFGAGYYTEYDLGPCLKHLIVSPAVMSFSLGCWAACVSVCASVYHFREDKEDVMETHFWRPHPLLLHAHILLTLNSLRPADTSSRTRWHLSLPWALSYCGCSILPSMVCIVSIISLSFNRESASSSPPWPLPTCHHYACWCHSGVNGVIII